MGYDIFISYSRKDTEIANAIEKELSDYGIGCFIDRSGINLGDDFAETISKAIFECKIMLFVWSENSNQSENTADEIALAIEFGKTIIPFKIGNFQPHYKLALRLTRFNRIDTVAFNHDQIVGLSKKLAYQLGIEIPSESVSGGDVTPVGRDVSNLYTLKVRPDVDSVIFIDDEQHSKIPGGRITRLPLNKGTYWIEVVSEENEEDRFVVQEYILADPEQLLIVDLKRIAQERAERDAGAETEAIEPEENAVQPDEVAEVEIIPPVEGTAQEDAQEEKNGTTTEGEQLPGIETEKDGLTEFQEGEKYYSEGKYTDAIACYQKGAVSGNRDAMYKFGHMLFYGEGTKKNKDKAVVWYTKAAEQNHMEAQYELGKYFYKIWSFDPEQATEWLRKAAEQGYVEAIYDYAYRFDLNKEYDKAIEWYLKAAEQGHAWAMWQLWHIYVRKGLYENKEEADKWRDRYHRVSKEEMKAKREAKKK